MLLKINEIFGFFAKAMIKLSALCGLLFGLVAVQVQGAEPVAYSAGGGLSFQTQGASARAVTNVPPQDQNTTVHISFDRMSLPAKVYIWNNVFGGSSNINDCSDDSCLNKDFLNSLVCFSTTDPTNGACPVKLFWKYTHNMTPTDLTLRFTHESGQTKDLKITSVKGRLGAYDSWITGIRLTPQGFNTSIPSSELSKVPLTGVWRAQLKMQVKNWNEWCNEWKDYGCPGVQRAIWKASITLNVTDYGNQQIYLPAFPTAAPVINLNLNTRPGASGGKTVSGSTSLDMCLYDGNNSASNRISLLLQDEGATATGRPADQFSIYRRGGDKSQARDRLDYQISVINPTTGGAQELANGKEVIWSDTNRRNIQRLVMLPGIGTPSLCVPAPLTLTTPEFSLANKTAGDYTGKLRIIYMPTTQTAQ